MSTLAFISFLIYFPHSCFVAAGGSNFGRSLYLLNASASNGTDVSPSFQEIGYTSDHTSNCTFITYGIPENTAAGDRDMSFISKLVKSRFNTQMNGVDATMPLLVTQVEIVSQKLGDAVRRLRRLGTSSDRRLISLKYASAFAMVRFACRGCTTDNRDGRRKLQEALEETEFVTELATDLKEGKSEYFSQALQDTSCFRVSCDGGAVQETDGCKDVALN
jgi:hypothetical protein